MVVDTLQRRKETRKKDKPSLGSEVSLSSVGRVAWRLALSQLRRREWRGVLYHTSADCPPAGRVNEAAKEEMNETEVNKSRPIHRKKVLKIEKFIESLPTWEFRCGFFCFTPFLPLV